MSKADVFLIIASCYLAVWNKDSKGFLAFMSICWMVMSFIAWVGER